MSFEYDLIFKGMELKKRGDIFSAIQFYKKSIEKAPRFKEAHYKLAVAYEELGEKKNAENSYRIALKIDPLFKEAWNNLGNLLYEQKRYKEALKYFDRARKIDPNFVQASRNYAATLYNLKRKNEAIEILLDLTEKQPKNYENWDFILKIKADHILSARTDKSSIYDRAKRTLKNLKCLMKKSLLHWLILINRQNYLFNYLILYQNSSIICT